jgi:3-dehydroquinate synthase
MQTITVTHPAGSYPIYLGEGVVGHTGPRLAELGYAGRCAVVTNATVGPYHAEAVLESFSAAGFDPVRIDIPDGEQFKTLETVSGLYDMLVAAKRDRRSPLVALGGGVLADTVGFAAASYLRGVPLVQIPTTLLAMVDASVGGKTGVDLPQGKNLVGAFKQPEMVVIDPAVLTTLPELEFRAGMAEVVKHGIIDAPELFAVLENGSKNFEAQSEKLSPPSSSLPPPASLLSPPSSSLLSPLSSSLLPAPYSLTWMLYEAIQVKVRVVQEDPFEQGRRAVLNLGHTFAHAFERLADYKMRHGEAVAIGLVCAAHLARRLGLCDEATTARIVALLQQLDLPTRPPPFPTAEIWAAMATDKKRQGNTLRFILPRHIGQVDIFTGIADADVEAVLELP